MAKAVLAIFVCTVCWSASLKTRSPLFKSADLRQAECIFCGSVRNPEQAKANQKHRSGGSSMARATAKKAASPKKNGFQTPALPKAKPESVGFSSARLKAMSDVFAGEVEKGTLPGAVVMVG